MNIYILSLKLNRLYMVIIVPLVSRYVFVVRILSRFIKRDPGKLDSL